MPDQREPLKIIRTESRNAEGQPATAEKYSVYLTLNRSLTKYERDVINTLAVDRPLGIGGANPSTLPRTLLITGTTIEQVAGARDEIKAFVVAVESEGRKAELDAQGKADAVAAATDAESKRRQAIADSIDWTD